MFPHRRVRTPRASDLMSRCHSSDTYPKGTSEESGEDKGMLGSFKFKLVGTFLALSVLPLAAAFWGFSEVAERSVTSSADSRLEAGLTAALATFEEERRNAERAAERLGRDRVFQLAVARRDRAAIAPLLPRTPALRVELPGGMTIGRVPRLAAETTVSLVGPSNRTATIVAAVPLTDELARALRSRSGLEAPDELVIVGRDGSIEASSGAAAVGAVELLPGRVHESTVSGTSYRVLGTTLAAASGLELAALTPISAITSEKRELIGRLLVGLVGSLFLIATAAYIAGRSIAGSLGRLAEAANSIAAGRLRERVPVKGRDEFAQLGRAFNKMASQLEARMEDLEEERRRLREANARFGDALAATLDPEQLRRVIVETAVEATHADGGVVIAEDGSFVETGDVRTAAERLDFDLTTGRRSFGRLTLVGDGFDADQRVTAGALAAQAVVALENARLHRIVERQALVDGLTGLANRRQADATLASELARAERLGGPVGLILADLDDFKAVNDLHGHPTGDTVLREFAQSLLETIREIDTAARWGGEEFAVVLPGTDLEGAAHLAERVRRALARSEIVSTDGVRVPVTASFGVAASGLSTTMSELVDEADEALYRAKRAGKNRVYAGMEEVSRL
jgi:diguanylate cyclase (GGDEF)-like protein